MADDVHVVAPGPQDGTVRLPSGEVRKVPAGWAWLAPGDATVTRRVKQAGPHWQVQEKRGRKVFPRGVWAPAAQIELVLAQVAQQRSSADYATRRASDLKRRTEKQSRYVEEFRAHVLAFLRFAPAYRDLADQLAEAVTDHATPVGSGTVARTERIPVEQRAESAVIAWLRHQTTVYDQLAIARVRGERRKVRRLLAEQSRQLLEAYRQGTRIDPGHCPLQRALQRDVPADDQLAPTHQRSQPSQQQDASSAS